MFNFIKEKIDTLALLFCAVCAFFWIIFLSQKYYSIPLIGESWDMALYTQALWNMGHGEFFCSIIGTNIFAEHCHFLSLFLVPIYKFFPDPLILPYLKVGGFFIGSYVFFLILKKDFHPLIALGGMAAFIFAPANIAMLKFLFTYESLAIPFIFLIFWALQENKFGLYITSCVLLIMVKEQMPLVVMMFGVLALVVKKDDRLRWALPPLFMGLIIFIGGIFILVPHIRQQTHTNPMVYWNHYSRFGRTPVQIILFLISHFNTTLAQFISIQNLKWYLDLLGLWGWLSFLSPQVFLPAIPLFLKTILSTNPSERMVTTLYYAATFMPFIYLAFFQTLNYIQGRWRLAIILLVTAGMLALNILTLSSNKNIPSNKPSFDADAIAIGDFLDKIPPSASVLSCWRALPYLANREKLYVFRDYLTGNYFLTGDKFELPKDTEYLLLDFSELYVNKNRAKLRALILNNNWRLEGSINNIALFVNHQPEK